LNAFAFVLRRQAIEHDRIPIRGPVSPKLTAFV
jgi:hypothetical protein